jgi:hypothetical protein
VTSKGIIYLGTPKEKERVDTWAKNST